MQLDPFEFGLFFLSVLDLILHDNLLLKVLFLKLFDLTDAHELGLMASKSFTHSQLVLVLFISTFAFLIVQIAHGELLSARCLCRSTIF